MKYSKYIVFAFLIFNFAFCVPALAQTSDEYYNKAVNKYFLGDNDGALRDLDESLRLDPGNSKARNLQIEIKKDSGITPAPAPTPVPSYTPPAQPAPQPAAKSEIEELTRVIKKAISKEEAPTRVKPEPKPAKEPVQIPPHLIDMLKPTAPAAAFTLTRFDLAWIITSLLLIVYLTVRFALLYLKLEAERRSVQICGECKYANPGSAEFCGKCGARLKPWVGVTALQRKWYAKYNWKKNPFTLDIMPSLFTGYQTQVETIFEKVYQRTGHILVMGNKGVGKTTLLKWLTETLAKEFHTVYIPRPTDNFDDLLNFLADSLKLKKSQSGKISIYDMEALVSKTNRNILLLLDEAHEFHEDFERPLRTLGDVNGVNFILAGFPETHDKIKRSSPPFFDRIIQEVMLQHLSLEETTELIRKRIENVGGSGLAPFTPEALENIFKMSGGIPRLILKVSDWVIAEAIHNNVETINVSAVATFPVETSEPAQNNKEAK